MCSFCCRQCSDTGSVQKLGFFLCFNFNTNHIGVHGIVLHSFPPFFFFLFKFGFFSSVTSWKTTTGVDTRKFFSIAGDPLRERCSAVFTGPLLCLSLFLLPRKDPGSAVSALPLGVGVAVLPRPCGVQRVPVPCAQPL